jgi:dipeptidyl aminopeptidase/acylaminoacyl peptidase
VPNHPCVQRLGRSNRDNWIVVAAFVATLGAPLGGCNLDETNRPLSVVEQRPTDSATGAAGATTGAAGATEVASGGGAGSVTSGTAMDAWIAFDSDGGAFNGGNRDLYVIRPDGTGRRRLTTEPSMETQPTFSRDGTTLAFASNRAGGVTQIYVMDLATGRTTPVTSRPQGAHDPAFAFDGTRVGYRSGVSVFTALPDGGDERQVTDGQTCCTGAPSGAPVFLSDGQTTVYDDYNAIYSTSNGAARRTIVMPTTGEQSHPALAPDGLNITLQSTCLGDNAARSIWIVPATGTTNYSCADGRRLSRPGTDATHASWGPSNMIVWGSVDGGTNSSSPVPSSLVTWQDGTLRTLTSGNTDDRNPSWSPPGTVIGNW